MADHRDVKIGAGANQPNKHQETHSNRKPTTVEEQGAEHGTRRHVFADREL